MVCVEVHIYLLYISQINLISEGCIIYTKTFSQHVYTSVYMYTYILYMCIYIHTHIWSWLSLYVTLAVVELAMWNRQMLIPKMGGERLWIQIIMAKLIKASD